MNEAKEERQIAATLVSRIQEGDEAAEADAVRRYQRGLRFLLRRRTRDPELAEDLLQETWAVALPKLREAGIADPGRLAGFLCGIAKNLALGEHRKAQRRQTSADSELVEAVGDDAPGQFESISRAEMCSQVRRLLDELSVERDREILLRFYVQEDDKDDICSDLGIDGTHFNRVLFRAKGRFRELLVDARRRDRLHIV